MANCEARLIEWAMANAIQTGLKVKRLHWIESVLPSYYDFIVSFDLPTNRQVYGRGADCIEEIALAKALSEGLERVAMFSGTFENSNGFAGHTDEAKARKNASDELCERDGFFCHYLTQTPFKVISNDLNSQDLRNALHTFNAAGVEINIGRMNVLNGLCGVIASAKGTRFKKPFGLFVSLSAADTEEPAVQKALISLFMNVSKETSDEPICGIERQQFLNRSTVRASDQLMFAAHPNQANLLDRLWSTCDVVWKSVEHNVQTTMVSLPPPFNTAPIFVARAFCDAIQPLYFGQPKPDQINWKRLSEFCGRPKSEILVKEFLHPFA